MNITKRSIFNSLIIAALALTTGCNDKYIRINGQFHGKGGDMLYIEQITPVAKLLDSTALDSNGKFSYKYASSYDIPQFIHLRLDKNSIPLLVEKGENIKINSIYNIPGGYEVSGSDGSELMREFNKSMRVASNTIDSLYTLFNSSADSSIRDSLNREISNIYIAQKKYNIKFLIENCNSLVSLMAIYQKMPNGIVIFGENSDVLYFKMVADSLESRYPKSLPVKTLKRDILSFQRRFAVGDMLTNTFGTDAISSFPDIEMKDIYGKTRKLSDHKGDVILLCFWSAQDKSSPLLNSELKELYSAYKDRGLEIYQVSLDISKELWVSAVTTQKLPWVNVSDQQGTASIAVKNYNVTSLPTNYLINREGDIIGKNIYGTDLANKLAEQF